MNKKSFQLLITHNIFLTQNVKKEFLFLKKLIKDYPFFLSLIKNWEPLGVNDDQKISFLKKIYKLDKELPQGFSNYFLDSQKIYRNYFSHQEQLSLREKFGSHISSIDLRKIDENFINLERKGINHLDKIVVVLIAGGLGERLGYTDIKLKLSIHQFLKTNYLEYYCQLIKSLELFFYLKKKKKIEIPFLFMTSEMTEENILNELKKNNFFGLNRRQFTFLKQPSVPCFKDFQANFAFKNRYELHLKPSGHGDIHWLIHKNKLLEKKFKSKRYIFFIQDTNIQVANVFLSSLGFLVSKKSHFAWIGVSRRKNEKMGLIFKEIINRNQEKVYNLEYNLIEKKKFYQKDQFYLGNTNMFWMNAKVYQAVISRSQGLLENFINPKLNADNQTFKIANRKESLMQDIVKQFPDSKKVDVLSYERNFCFTPVKNQLIELIENPQQKFFTPLQAEENNFRNNRDILLQRNNVFLTKNKDISFLKNIFISDQAKVYLHPFYRIFHDSTVKLGIKNSTFLAQSLFVLNCPNVFINFLLLEKKSAILIEGSGEAKLTIKNLTVKNKGYILRPLKKKDYASSQFTLQEKLFGYRFDWVNPLRINLPPKGEYVLNSKLKLIRLK